MRVVFMGTPAFAIPVLDALTEAEGVEVAGVFTPPDRPGGRGRNPVPSPVKTHALARGLNLLQPPSLRTDKAQESLAGLSPDVIVVAAYGRILPPRVLALPLHGCLNLHPSLLPRYRGPSPVVTAILDGGAATGVSLMLLDQGMDTGPVIDRRDFDLAGQETAETLTADLFRLGTGMLLDNLEPWVAGKLVPQPQNEADSTVTRKVEREDGRADWQVSGAQLERRRRAYTPWPGLYTFWEGKVLKLLSVTDLPTDAIPEAARDRSPGSVVPLSSEETPLGVITGLGVLGLKSLQLEGRKAVPAPEFLRGYPTMMGAQL
ncbi:MAG: methionyl-tRNA formyltransferase [SAR202 cluster bacterium Io17-Chloro-G9]|nr:MAG: methionyl-tRNA formyltransferase [SAR202 cluster bacterium Io17-Chloro-G9]